jgi:hypothetical protein
MYRVALTAKYVNIKFILYPHVFSGIKTVNHGILDIAEAPHIIGWINMCPCEQIFHEQQLKHSLLKHT